VLQPEDFFLFLFFKILRPFFYISYERLKQEKKGFEPFNSFDKIKVSITEGGGIGGTFMVA